jgi:DUF4097 and DUF4098 domain-containing protein YvlB
MKTTVSMLLALAMAAAAPAARCDERNFDRTLDVSPGGLLTVEADGADVTVTAVEGKQVVVHVKAKGSASVLENMTLSADKSATGVAVVVKRKSGLGNLLHVGFEALDVSVTVPKAYNAEVRTSGGDLVFSQLQGTATGKTSGGDVRVNDIQGPVTMRTSGGDVRIETIQGRVDAKSSGGDMTVHNVRGDLEIGTSGGNIRAEDVVGAVKLGTSGGDITAHKIAGPLAARTTGGDVRLEQMDGAVQASTSGGKIEVELLGANRGIDVATSGSNITLQLPAVIAATVDAAAGSGKVKSELPITGTRNGESRIQGTINGGGATIRAKTSGGNISLLAKK